MKQANKFKSSQGMTLIEVMIAIGITSIMTLAVMMMAQLSTSLMSTARMNSDIDTKLALAKMILSHKEWCKAALRSEPVTRRQVTGPSLSTFDVNTAPPELFGIVELQENASGNFVPRTGSKLLVSQSLAAAEANPTLAPNGYVIPLSTDDPPGLTIDQPAAVLSNQLREFGGTLRAFDVVTTTITINAIKVGSHIGSRQVVRKIPVEFVLGPTDGANPTPTNIRECYAKDVEQTSMQAACTAMGGMFDSTRNPPCLLSKLTVADNTTKEDEIKLNNALATQNGAKLNDVIIGRDPANFDFVYDYESIGVPANRNLRLQSANNIIFHTGTNATGTAIDSSQRMIITPTGNVGFGVTGNPLQNVHIGGDSTGGGNQTGLQVGDVGKGYGPLYLVHNSPQIRDNSYYNSGDKYGGGTGKPSIIDLSNGIHFQTSNNPPGAAGSTVAGIFEAMTITSDGKVGIGTSSPTEKLDINGAVSASGGIIPGTIAGTACTTEGRISYDSNAHKPVYCSQNSVWTAIGGSPVTLPEYYEASNSSAANLLKTDSGVRVVCCNDGDTFMAIRGWSCPPGSQGTPERISANDTACVQINCDKDGKNATYDGGELIILCKKGAGF